MKKRALIVLMRMTQLAAVVPLFITSVAVAQTFPPQYANALQRAQYQVFSGDVNGDNYTDVLVKAKPRIALIDFDVPIPVPLRPVSPTFILMSHNGGPYSVDVNPPSSQVNSAVWQPSTYDIVFGDVAGSGSVSLLLRGRNAGLPSFLVSTSPATGSPVLTQELSFANIGYELSGPNTTVVLSDTNHDGRADLVIRVNGMISAVLAASADGTFSKPSSEQDRVMVSWRGFCAALNAADVGSASQFISPESRDLYVPVLSGMGNTITAIAPTWSEPKAVNVGDSFALYSMVQTVPEGQSLHLLVFVRSGGGWVLSQF